jgi:pentafunctional AROM polypeptide
MTKVYGIKVLGRETVFVGSEWQNEWIQRLVQAIGPKISTFAIITDSTVAQLHLPKVQQALEDELMKSVHEEVNGGQNGGSAQARVLKYIIPAGESHKTRETKAKVEDYLLDNFCTRGDTCLIALGGGVVGDLTGFVAATFMRGVPFIQVPTTLLAIVDSSVGGKTAVDTRAGKNLVGAFWQPVQVYVDCSFLRTLPRRQFVNGMAEVIKAGAFWDSELFSILEKNVDLIVSDNSSEVSVSDLSLFQI